LQSAAWSELDRKFAKYDRYLAGWCFSTSRYAESNRREDDGFGWPRRDGLKWPHFALVDVLVR
jgi:hypothetical protein